MLVNRNDDACPVCDGETRPHDVVDFNKSCMESAGQFLRLSGRPIYYFICESCGFCYAPEIHRWSLEEFSQRIYNDDYKVVDPDYLDKRPRENARYLEGWFAGIGQRLRHLDYGGGNGLLSRILREKGWQSISYDPFVDRDMDVGDLGVFDLITSFEVFEHVPDVRGLASGLASLLADEGMVYFTTLLSDGNVVPYQRLNWWYASPRNGHISLYAKRSVEILGAREDLNFTSFTPNTHSFWRRQPPWAQHIFRSVA